MNEPANRDETVLNDVDDKRQVRSRFRVVTVHVLRSAVFPPFVVKYILFAFLALAKVRPRFAVPLWIIGCIAVYVYSSRRSLASIRRNVTVPRPERCVVPSLLAFAAFAFFSFVIDVALATNSGVRPGQLILLSAVLNFGILVGQTLATQRTFSEMPGAGELPFSVRQILFFIGDVAVLIAFVVMVLAAISVI